MAYPVVTAEAEPGDPLGRKPGEWLWDDDYGYARFLAREKATQLPRNWSALYQRRPAPETGSYFKDEWCRSYVNPPERSTLNVYGGSDYAVTANGGDYTMRSLGSIQKNKMYLLDLWRGQTSSDQWIEAWCDLVCKWRPLFWAEERGQIISGIGPYLQRRAIERRAYTAREQFVSRGDKATRAQSFRGRMAMLGLYVPTRASWYPALRSELLSFPAGKYDDQIDALGLVGQLSANQDGARCGMTALGASQQRSGLGDTHSKAPRHPEQSEKASDESHEDLYTGWNGVLPTTRSQQKWIGQRANFDVHHQQPHGCDPPLLMVSNCAPGAEKDQLQRDECVAPRADPTV